MKRSGHYNSRSAVRTPRARRSGAVMLELILMLPVWLIAFAAMVEFGTLMANRQYVALASRVGAEAASDTPDLDLTNAGDPVPAQVIQAIEQHLNSTGIVGTADPTPGIYWSKIVLQHNVGGTAVTLESDNIAVLPACTCCDAPIDDLPTTTEYVRVTVFVPVTELTPNLLNVFGLDFSGHYISHTTTFPYEL